MAYAAGRDDAAELAGSQVQSHIEVCDMYMCLMTLGIQYAKQADGGEVMVTETIRASAQASRDAEAQAAVARAMPPSPRLPSQQPARRRRSLHQLDDAPMPDAEPPPPASRPRPRRSFAEAMGRVGAAGPQPTHRRRRRTLADLNDADEDRAPAAAPLAQHRRRRVRSPSGRAADGPGTEAAGRQRSHSVFGLPKRRRSLADLGEPGG